MVDGVFTLLWTYPDKRTRVINSSYSCFYASARWARSPLFSDKSCDQSHHHYHLQLNKHSLCWRQLCFFFFQVHEHYPNANGACQKTAQDSQHSSPSRPGWSGRVFFIFTGWVYTCPRCTHSTEQTLVHLYESTWSPLLSYSDRASRDSCQYGIHVLQGL